MAMTGLFIWALYVQAKSAENGEYLKLLSITLLELALIAAGLYYSLSGSLVRCQAIDPYKAQDVDTGECRVFDYGGCGPRPHPYYYEMGCSQESANEICQEYQKEGYPGYSERFCYNGTAREYASDVKKF